MENKYYRPSLEEFYLGFEYERFIPKSNSTEEGCWEKITMSVNYLSLDEIDDEILEKEIKDELKDNTLEVSSNEQLGKALEKYGLPNLGRTKKGHYQTGTDILQQWKNEGYEEKV